MRIAACVRWATSGYSRPPPDSPGGAHTPAPPVSGAPIAASVYHGVRAASDARGPWPWPPRCAEPKPDRVDRPVSSRDGAIPPFLLSENHVWLCGCVVVWLPIADCQLPICPKQTRTSIWSQSLWVRDIGRAATFRTFDFLVWTNFLFDFRVW